MSKLLFTNEELDEMGRLTRDLIKEAIDEGDLDRAKKLTDRMYREFLSMHDLYLYWVTATLSHIGRKHGDKALYDALKEGCSAWVLPTGEAYHKVDIEKKVRMFATGIRGHLQPFTVEEDEEKFTITPDICPSGGRLIKNGCYKPPLNFMKIADSQPMTYGQKDFPVYCAHCFFQTLLLFETGLNPFIVVEPADDLNTGPCRSYFYKDPANIPEKFFEQVNVKKDEFLKKLASKA